MTWLLVQYLIVLWPTSEQSTHLYRRYAEIEIGFLAAVKSSALQTIHSDPQYKKKCHLSPKTPCVLCRYFRGWRTWLVSGRYIRATRALVSDPSGNAIGHVSSSINALHAHGIQLMGAIRASICEVLT